MPFIGLRALEEEVLGTLGNWQQMSYPETPGPKEGL